MAPCQHRKTQWPLPEPRMNKWSDTINWEHHLPPTGHQLCRNNTHDVVITILTTGVKRFQILMEILAEFPHFVQDFSFLLEI